MKNKLEKEVFRAPKGAKCSFDGNNAFIYIKKTGQKMAFAYCLECALLDHKMVIIK